MRLNLRRGSEEPVVVQPEVRRAPVEKLSKMPAAGNLLRDRGRRRVESDIANIWSSSLIDDHIDTDEDDRAASFLSQSYSKAKTGLKVIKRQSGAQFKTRPQSRSAAEQTTVSQSNRVATAAPRTVNTIDMFQTKRAPRAFQPHRKKIASRRQAVDIVKRIPVRSVVAGRRKVIIGILGVFIMSAGAFAIFRGSSGNQSQTPTSVSSSEVAGTQTAQPEVPIVSSDETSFELLYPSGKDAESFEIAQVNPPDSDPVYAYVDKITGVELRISQQKVPDRMRDTIDQDIERIAKDFQATDVIQIDDLKVYHGFTEKHGGVQSLVFTKNDTMVFISSAKKFSDDTWAGYILGLQKAY